MQVRVTRRRFLAFGAMGSLSLVLRGLVPASARGGEARAERPALRLPSYSGYQDVYRQAWTWDRVVRGTHLRANCFSACAWDLYVKDGIVWREEQTDAYRRPDSPLPDYGPRGCQKGACYSSLMTAPDRLLYPMARVGERGSGRWKRISWDEALGRLADAIIDASEEGGAETVV
ncbi:MAG: nitrate reductase, partial [Deltaproteobacteria bacterium]